MPILRNPQKEQYTIITNSTIRDMRLRNKDIGALVRLLSLPDGWEFSVRGLIVGKVMPDGKEAIGASLRQLEKYGYLRRIQRINEQGHFAGREWEVRETPITVFPSSGKPPTGKPPTRKPQQSITDVSITDLSITECGHTLSPEEYGVLAEEYGRELVDYQIRRILENKYANCMNATTIAQWCQEHQERKKVPYPCKNLFAQGIRQNYGDIAVLEKEIISN